MRREEREKKLGFFTSVKNRSEVKTRKRRETKEEKRSPSLPLAVDSHLSRRRRRSPSPRISLAVAAERGRNKRDRTPVAVVTPLAVVAPLAVTTPVVDAVFSNPPSSAISRSQVQVEVEGDVSTSTHVGLSAMIASSWLAATGHIQLALEPLAMWFIPSLDALNN
ncbi:hypothetical protein LWI29_021899 [Acer saccharum]|uniref:Uncharacterized protein n=1 Tax=Acer saccharum TaxID=4024 RepID=A0AA39S9F8_ACESA|nr:hypothetical protein LWI29_021899 [Acer saccharum]